jgi:hypothetical protein
VVLHLIPPHNQPNYLTAHTIKTWVGSTMIVTRLSPTLQ